MSWPYGTSTTVMLSGMEGLAYPPFQPTPGRYSQGVYERLDYPIDWSDWVPAGDAIITSTWTVVATWPAETAGLTALTVSDGGHTSTGTTVLVSGGDESSRYDVMNLVTTTGGLTGTRFLQFRITGYPHHRFGHLHGNGALTAVTVSAA